MTGDPVREVVRRIPERITPSGRGLRAADFRIRRVRHRHPRWKPLDRTRRGPCMSFFNEIGLSKSEALNRVRMNKGWL